MITVSPIVGVALGSGGARGWAHIGVLRTLLEHGIEPARKQMTALRRHAGLDS